MKRLLILAALSASLMTSACVTVIDASDDADMAWHGENAQPFDAARDACRASTGRGPAQRRLPRLYGRQGLTPQLTVKSRTM